MYLAMRKQNRLLNAYRRQGMAKKYREQKKTLPKLTAADVNEPSNVKMVFVTQSPVLTNEVKQYYASLKQQLAAHLLVVERVNEEKKQAREESKGSEAIGTEEEANGQQKGQEEAKRAAATQNEAESERDKLLKFLEIREKEILQAESVE